MLLQACSKIVDSNKFIRWLGAEKSAGLQR